MTIGFSLAAEDLPLPGKAREFTLGNFRVVWEHLREGASRGVERLTVHHGENSVAILPTRGMGIERARIDGVDFHWSSPVAGPVHPALVPMAEPNGLGWLQGFTELLCRCGLTSNGAPGFDRNGRLTWPLHGLIANQPAREVSFGLAEDGSLEIAGRVDEKRMHFWKWQMDTRIRLKPGLASVVIEDKVTNASGSTDRFQNLYHYNLGAPLLEAGAKVVAPVRRVVPRDDHSAGRVQEWSTIWGPVPGDFERVYFLELAFDTNGRSLAMLKNAAGTAATAIRFSRDDGLKCLTLWKNLVAEADGYVIGLEPATNWPNHRDFEVGHGRCVELPAGGSQTMSVTMEFVTSRSGVEALERECDSIHPAQRTVVEPAPVPAVCAIQKLAWDQ